MLRTTTFFTYSFVTLVLAQILSETYLSKLIPPDRPALRRRFWTRAVMDVSITVLSGLIIYSAVAALEKAGRNKTAWGLAIIPGVFLVFVTFLHQGTNTILDRSSGVGCYGLIFSALKARN